MKKYLKKLLAAALAVVLLVAPFSLIAAFAADDPAIVIGTASGKAGQSVNIPVSIANNPGIVTMYLNLSYDTTRLALKSVQNGSILSDPAHGNNLSAVPFSLNWDGSLLPANITDSGVIAMLEFEIVSGAPAGEANITIGYDPANVYDFNFTQVAFTVESGSITVLPKEAASIAMKTSPTKTTYIEGQDLDLSGAAITVTYDNGTTADMPVTSGMVSGYNKNQIGVQNVTVSYAENGVTKTTGFSVTVQAKSLTGIAVTSPPAKTEYIEGQFFDKTGMAVTAYYNNGTSAALNPEDYSVTPSALAYETTQVIVTYLGQTAAQSVTVAQKQLSSIAVTTNPTKTAYKAGNTFSAAGGKLTLTYDNGDTEIIGLTDEMCSGYNLNPGTFGQQSVTVTYMGKTTTFTITVQDKELESISIKTQPSVKSFVEGAGFTVDGMITLHYNNGTAEDKNITAGMCSGYDKNTLGNQTITINESGKTVTYQITVVAKNLAGIAITTPPTQTTYIEGKAFNNAGMAVTAYYNNGTNAVITGYAVDKTILVLGDTGVTVSYTENGVTKTAETPVSVSAKTLTGITITSPPTKTAYMEGESFDKSGMVVRANYDNDTGETVTSYIVSTAPLAVEQTSVTVTYLDKTASVPVSVRAKALSGIAVTTLPAKLVYLEGQPLDTDGGVITLTYDNGFTEPKAITSGMVTGYNANQSGQQTITVTEGGKTTTFTVTVNAKTITGIAMKSPPAKTVYIEGQDLVLSGAVITVTYDNGTAADVNVTAGMIGDYNKNTVGLQAVTVTCGGKTTTFAVTVNAKALTDVSLNSDSAKKLYLEGSDFSLENLILTVAYDNGAAETVTVTPVMVSGYDKDVVGEQTITVAYGGFAKTYTVTVVSRRGVDEVIEAIGNIIISDLSAADKDDIFLLKEAYEALSEVEKAGVSNSEKEKLAEAVLIINDLLFPAFDQWNSDKTVNVKAGAGVLPYDTVLKVDEITATSDLLAGIRKIYGANSLFAGFYDITLADAAGAIISSFEGVLQIKIKLPDEYADGKDLVLAYIAENSTITPVTAVFSDGYAIFEVDHLSQYAVVKKIGTLDDGDSSVSTVPDSPKTGDTSFPVAVIIIMLLAASAVAMTVIAGKRKTDN